MEAGFFSFRSGSAYPNVGTRWVYAFRICVAQRHSEFMDRRTSRTIHDLGAVFARSIPLYFSVFRVVEHYQPTDTRTLGI